MHGSRKLGVAPEVRLTRLVATLLALDRGRLRVDPERGHEPIVEDQVEAATVDLHVGHDAGSDLER